MKRGLNSLTLSTLFLLSASLFLGSSLAQTGGKVTIKLQIVEGTPLAGNATFELSSRLAVFKKGPIICAR